MKLEIQPQTLYVLKGQHNIEYCEFLTRFSCSKAFLATGLYLWYGASGFIAFWIFSELPLKVNTTFCSLWSWPTKYLLGVLGNQWPMLDFTKLMCFSPHLWTWPTILLVLNSVPQIIHRRKVPLQHEKPSKIKICQELCTN